MQIERRNMNIAQNTNSSTNARTILVFINEQAPSYTLQAPGSQNKSMSGYQGESLLSKYKTAGGGYSGFFASPNPSDGLITLKLKDAAVYENAMYVITNLEGKIVLNQRINNLSTQIDLSRFDAGIYLVQLLKDNEVIDVQKIVLNK